MLSRVVFTVIVLASLPDVASAVGSAAAPPEAPLRDCGARHESSKPITDRVTANDVRVGPFVMIRYPEWRKPLRAYGANPQPEEWPYVLKAPVRLRAGATVTLAIAPAAADLVALLPSNSQEWLPAVRFRACASNRRAHAYKGTVGPITGFGLALGLKNPSACIPMEIWFENRATPLRRIVPIGRLRC